ncbi:MAG: RHS repeat-associated core domain-containing protein [Pseudomonadota bacterium]
MDAFPIAADTALTTASGESVMFTTGAFGEVVSQVDEAGLPTLITRSSDGLPLMATLPSGRQIIRTFNGVGDVLSEFDSAFAGTTTYRYDNTLAQLIELTDSLGNITSWTYDDRGNATQITSPLGRALQFEHDERGLITAFVERSGLRVEVSYGAAGLASAITASDGNTARSGARTHTLAGNLMSETNAVGETQSFTYDALGRLNSVTLADGRGVGVAFDAQNNLTSVTPPGRDEYRFEYDHTGRTTAYHPPSGAPMRWEYTLAGDLALVRRADGREVSLRYDDAGRLVEVTEPDGMTTLAYDPSTGELNQIASTDGVTLSYEYAAGVKTRESWSGAVDGYVGYAYDAKGRVSALDINGSIVSYGYDADDEITSVDALTLTYDESTGDLLSVSAGVVTESFTYNAFGELTSHQVTAGASILYDAEYVLDGLGRIAQATVTIEGDTMVSSYAYDAAGRLTSATVDGTPTDYVFDENDNRLDLGATYNALDQVQSLGTTTFAYNGDGDRVARTQSGVTTLYEYSALGQLRSVDDGTTSVTYLNDGEGRRVGRLEGATLTEGRLYAGNDRLLARLDGAQSTTQRFVYADKRQVPSLLIDGTDRYKVVSDQIGSVRLVVDIADGSVAQRLDYDPWGAVTLDTNPQFQPFGFAGGTLEADAGLVQFGTRDYDPDTQQWTQRDPSYFSGSAYNLYAYAGADPVNFFDFSGLRPVRATRNVARVVDIAGAGGLFLVQEDGTRTLLRPGDRVCVGDVLETDVRTIAVLEFAIGGQANLGRGDQVRVVSDIAIESIDQSFLTKLSGDWGRLQKLEKNTKKLRIRTTFGEVGIEG